MIAAVGDTAKSKREPAAEPQTARSARHAGPGPGLVPWPHQQAATIGISGNAPRHAAQSALAQSEAHTPAVMDGWDTELRQSSGGADLVIRRGLLGNGRGLKGGGDLSWAQLRG
jgi:hypothetical protein